MATQQSSKMVTQQSREVSEEEDEPEVAPPVPERKPIASKRSNPAPSLPPPKKDTKTLAAPAGKGDRSSSSKPTRAPAPINKSKKLLE